MPGTSPPSKARWPNGIYGPLKVIEAEHLVSKSSGVLAWKLTMKLGNTDALFYRWFSAAPTAAWSYRTIGIGEWEDIGKLKDRSFLCFIERVGQPGKPTYNVELIAEIIE